MDIVMEVNQQLIIHIVQIRGLKVNLYLNFDVHSNMFSNYPSYFKMMIIIYYYYCR
jgi:hypothetical protein